MGGLQALYCASDPARKGGPMSSIASMAASYARSVLSHSSPRQSYSSRGPTQSSSRADFVDTSGYLDAGSRSEAPTSSPVQERGGTGPRNLRNVPVLQAPKTGSVVGSVLGRLIGIGGSTFVSVALTPTMTAPPELDELSPERLARFQRDADLEAQRIEAAGMVPQPFVTLKSSSSGGLVVLPLDRPVWPAVPAFEVDLEELDLPPVISDFDIPAPAPLEYGDTYVPSDDIGRDLSSRRQLERDIYRGRQKDQRLRERWRDPVRIISPPAGAEPLLPDRSRRRPRDVPRAVRTLEVDFSPHGPIRFRTRRDFRWMRRRRDSKYDMFYMWALQVIEATWGQFSEMDDMVQSVMWAVYEPDPRDPNRLVQSLLVRDSYLEVARAVARGEAELNMAQAVVNIALNEVQDQIIGRLSHAVQSELNKAGWFSPRGVMSGSRMRSSLVS